MDGEHVDRDVLADRSLLILNKLRMFYFKTYSTIQIQSEDLF